MGDFDDLEEIADRVKADPSPRLTGKGRSRSRAGYLKFVNRLADPNRLDNQLRWARQRKVPITLAPIGGK